MTQQTADWLRAARMARLLSWASLFWMILEGAGGLWAGFGAGSIALVGWALSSAVEGMASVIVIWRFSGRRLHSEDAEAGAMRAVAVSFWLLAPYVLVESVRKLAAQTPARISIPGMALTAASLVLMPALGKTKHRLGERLGSGATAGEGTQNLLCAALAAGVLGGLVLNALLGWWWVDPLVGLGVAGVAVKEGFEAWRGEGCCTGPAAAREDSCAKGCCGED
jgi:divalent metal cation (Fe/Co/Zn/Cd) transporter